MKIAILGTRGIPNNYGGFEQFAEYLALGLVKRGFDVIVYNSDTHPYQEHTWNGVKIVHCYDPEVKLGTMGQFIYDLNCILDVRRRKCDIILQLGYTSSSIWGWLMPKESVITTNMDGLEWRRTKYSKLVKKFLLYAEKLGVKYSDHLISDSIGIQEYIQNKYNQSSTYIAYGATLFVNSTVAVLDDYSLAPHNYDMLIARLEPENSIEIILDGVVQASVTRDFIVIGNHETSYGSYLKKKYLSQTHIRFIGGVYDINVVNNLRFFSNIYFHGHTVGGTNPSLLEAMASNSLICAHKNPFNRHILGNDAFYFTNSEDVSVHLNGITKCDSQILHMLDNNNSKIVNAFDWELIVDKYVDHFNEINRC